MSELPPYQMNPVCPACGCGLAARTYHPEDTGGQIVDALVFVHRIAPLPQPTCGRGWTEEHMHRTCCICGYEWAEKPLFASEEVEAKIKQWTEEEKVNERD